MIQNNIIRCAHNHSPDSPLLHHEPRVMCAYYCSDDDVLPKVESAAQFCVFLRLATSDKQRVTEIGLTPATPFTPHVHPSHADITKA